MKVIYNIKEGVQNFAYTADLTFQDLNPQQLEYIRAVLSSVTKYNKLFEEERDEFGGQNLIDLVSAELKKANKKGDAKFEYNK